MAIKNLFPLSILIVTLVLGMSSNSWAIDEFLKAQPADTINPGTIGTVLRVNNEAIDRFFTYGRFDCKLTYAAAAQVNVGSGSIVCSNSAGTVRKLRTNTSTVNCTWSDLDSGVEASSTTYYVWAVGDTDATTFTVKISTSATAPTGVTYYKRLGSFYNDASSNITDVKNDNNTGSAGKSYDTGAQTFAVNTAYTVTHSLGTTALIIQPYFRASASESWKVCSYLEEPDDDNPWEGFSVYDVTNTAVSFRVANRVSYTGSDGTRTDLTSGQYRIVILSIE